MVIGLPAIPRAFPRQALSPYMDESLIQQPHEIGSQWSHFTDKKLGLREVKQFAHRINEWQS